MNRAVPRTVLFRVDASLEAGTGHVARCATLARAFASYGERAVFLSHRMPAKLRDQLSASFEVLEAEHEAGSPEDCAETRDWIKRLGVGALVLDGYKFGAEYSGAMQHLVTPVVSIEDGTRLHVPCDLLLNHHLFAHELEYDSSSASVLRGPLYALVRDEFLAARRGGARGRAQGRPKHEVVVTMGGADPVDHTSRVLRELAEAPSLEVTAIVGAANPREEALRESFRRAPNIRIAADVQDLGKRFAQCDIAILAAGTTVLEAACVGVPMLMVAIADNQRPVATAAERAGWGQSLGEHEDVAEGAWRRAVEHLIAEPDRMSLYIERQHSVIDGRGAYRVAEQVLTRIR